MSVRLTYHGGGCCGVRHLSNMYAGNSADIRQRVAEVQSCIRTVGKGRLYEIILNHTQAKSGMLKALLDIDFRLVTKFKNSTGSTCYVLHYAATGHKTSRVAGTPTRPLNVGPSKWIDD